MLKSKSPKKQNIFASLFIKIQFIDFIVSLAGLVLSSLIIFNADNIPVKAYFYIITAILSATNFFSGFYVGIKLRKNGMLNSLLYNMPLNIIYLVISSVLNLFKIDLTILFAAIIILSSSMLGGVLSVNNKSIAKTKRVGR